MGLIFLPWTTLACAMLFPMISFDWIWLGLAFPVHIGIFVASVVRCNGATWYNRGVVSLEFSKKVPKKSINAVLRYFTEPRSGEQSLIFEKIWPHKKDSSLPLVAQIDIQNRF